MARSEQFKGRSFSAAEGILRAITQAMMKPFAMQTSSLTAGGYLTGSYGLMLMIYGLMTESFSVLCQTCWKYKYWMFVLGLGSALRSAYYYMAYASGAPPVIPYFAVNSLSAVLILILAPFLVGDRFRPIEVPAGALALLAGYFLFHCPDPYAFVQGGLTWVSLCLMVAPFSALAVVASRKLAHNSEMSISAITFWSGVSLVIGGGAMSVYGIVVDGADVNLPIGSWLILLSANTLAIAYVPFGLAAIRRLGAFEKNVWVLGTIGTCTVLIRAGEMFSKPVEQQAWDHVGYEALGIALYLVSVLILIPPRKFF